MTYLITGATGNIGSLVVELLLARGIRPRILVRDLDKARARFGDRVDVARGDLEDARSLTPALAGADAIFLVNSGPELAARDGAAAAAAKSAGVKQLVKLSTNDAREQIGTGVWHAQGEAAVRASGIPFTFVQPSGFMVNALWWAPSIKASGMVRSPTGDGRIPFIHSADIAAVVVAALTTRDHLGASLDITGPEALSYAQMVAKMTADLPGHLRRRGPTATAGDRRPRAAGRGARLDLARHPRRTPGRRHDRSAARPGARADRLRSLGPGERGGLSLNGAARPGRPARITPAC
jgi:uncharacterized protein YbjT (DUF2867 family)